MAKLPSGPWFKNWAGDWSLLSCSYFGRYYTETALEALGTRVDYAVLVGKNGKSACYFPQHQIDAFGKDLARQALADAERIPAWCTTIKRQADALLEWLTDQKPRLDSRQFNAFERQVRGFSTSNFAVKKVVDYLSADALKNALPLLQDARKHTEPVYEKTEHYVDAIVNQLAARTKQSRKTLETLTCAELDEFFKNGRLPDMAELQTRVPLAVLVFNRGRMTCLTGTPARRIEAAVTKAETSDAIRGHCAYPGKASGRVQIVWNPDHAAAFQTGGILVTGMTRPEYLPLFKKAAAVVTDAGGILSHAAIVARELKKPCVIGTLNATARLKDGDRVEVDAAAGTIKTVRNAGRKKRESRRKK